MGLQAQNALIYLAQVLGIILKAGHHYGFYWRYEMRGEEILSIFNIVIGVSTQFKFED